MISKDLENYTIEWRKRFLNPLGSLRGDSGDPWASRVPGSRLGLGRPTGAQGPRGPGTQAQVPWYHGELVRNSISVEPGLSQQRTLTVLFHRI